VPALRVKHSILVRVLAPVLLEATAELEHCTVSSTTHGIRRASSLEARSV
jgi:hypothetical protein